MSFDTDHTSALEPLADEGWITEILHEVRSGKEATVFCCRGGPRSPHALVAAKVHRPIETRSFRNDAVYLEGRVHMVRANRARRAVEAGSEFGRAVRYATWIAEEWEVLGVLHDCGVRVPQPIAVGERAVLMEFIGDEQGPAPMLHEVRPGRPATVRLVDQLLEAIEHMLHLDCVHGDLSPHNVMVVNGRDAVIIDFPQAIDPRLNHAALPLLTRDVERICIWAEQRGVSRPADRIARRLWARFKSGEIG